MEATREIYWNIDHATIPLMYLFAFAAIGWLAWGFIRRLSVWRQGRPLDRFDQPLRRFARLVRVNVSQRLVGRSGPGRFHALWFWAFALLFIGTLIVMAQADLFGPLFGIRFFRGTFYLWYSLALDLAGALAFLALLALFVRRFILRPKSLETGAQDWIAHGILIVILATGFCIEGLRMAATELAADPALAAWSPVGRAFAFLFAGLDASLIGAWHRGLWWFHFALAISFIAIIPMTKLRHILTTAANAWFAPLDEKGAIDTIDLEDEKVTSYGIAEVPDLSWKDIFDADACTSCARCQDACPAYATDKPLSPMKVVHQIGEASLRSDSAARAASARAVAGRVGSEAPGKEAAKQGSPPAPEAEKLCDLVGSDALWACTTCRACQETCPAGIEQVNKILGMRRNLALMEGSFPDEGSQLAATNIEVNGNPFGLAFAGRGDWADGFDLVNAASGRAFDLLYFAGCYASFDARNRKVARSFVELCQAAGLRVAILGGAEKCCGEPVRKLGNEYLYQAVAALNIEAIKASGAARIVTTCPHCFNTLSRDYRDLGLDIPVEHHSTLIEELADSGKLALRSEAFDVTYHDSCYIGRYKDILREPRRLLARLGGRIVEMEKHGMDSFCCGGGGGRILAEEKLGGRISEKRAAMAGKTGAPLLATNCPFCVSMLEDGSKAVGLEGKLEVRDIAELAAERLVRPARS